MTTIFGQERALIDGLTNLLLGEAKRRHDYTAARQTPRGATFDLRLTDPDLKPTGRVARVTIEILPLESTNDTEHDMDGAGGARMRRKIYWGRGVGGDTAETRGRNR